VNVSAWTFSSERRTLDFFPLQTLFLFCCSFVFFFFVFHVALAGLLLLLLPQLFCFYFLSSFTKLI